MGTVPSLNLISLRGPGETKARPGAPTSGPSAGSRRLRRQVTGTRVSLVAEGGVSPPLRLGNPTPNSSPTPGTQAPRGQRRSPGRSIRRDGERCSRKPRLQKRHGERETEARPSGGRGGGEGGSLRQSEGEMEGSGWKSRV